MISIDLSESGYNPPEKNSTSEFKEITIDLGPAPTEIVVQEPTAPAPKRRGRPPKKVEDGSVHVDSANLMTSNTPYISTYSENMEALKGVVCQADMVATQLKTMMDSIVSSKTMKNKFMNAANCGTAINGFLSTKLNAIKEMNKTIYDSHQLEAKRAQALKAAEQATANDDKYIQDLYTAFVNTPISSGMSSPINVMANNVVSNPTYQPSNSMADGMQGYQDFTQNLTPEQNRMILGDNPNIETVVVHNEYTGESRFDVIDTNTGMRVPNYPLPDQCMLDGIKINKITGIASNTNFNETWKLILEGAPDPNCF